MAILSPFVWHSCYLQFCRIVSLIGICRDASLRVNPQRLRPSVLVKLLV
jgi:hypothetical protein